MTLDELIAALEAEHPDKICPDGFANPHSYRGDYYDLAFEPATNVTIGDMLDDARRALNTTYQGYKGGDFRMGGHSECWLAHYGDLGETIGPLLLRLMLAAGRVPDAEAGLTPPSERRAQYLGEISVTIENRLRAKGHAAAADEIVGIMRELATDGSSR